MTPPNEPTLPPNDPLESGATESIDTDDDTLRSIPKAFAIDSEQAANWLVRKVLGARDYGQRVKRWAEREQRRAEREEKTLTMLFGRQLEAWARREVARFNGRRKSICLPAGTLGFRHAGAKLVIDDEIVVIEWARRHLPSAIRTEERLVRTVVRTHFASTGELPPIGAHVQPSGERFHIG